MNRLATSSSGTLVRKLYIGRNFVILSMSSVGFSFRRGKNEQSCNGKGKILSQWWVDNQCYQCNQNVKAGYYWSSRECFKSDDLPRVSKIINQSIKFLQRQYPRRSQAQWCYSQISVQQQNRGNSFETSTGHGEWRYLWGKGQVEEMCLQVFLEGSNWTGWTNRQWEAVPKRWGTRVKSSSTSIGLDHRDWQAIIVV